MLSHDDWQLRLRTLKAPVTAAELHGALAGYLCAGSGVDRHNWLLAVAQNELAETIDGDSGAIEAFAELYDSTRDGLYDPDLSFTPLLPDDDSPIESRTHALVEWARSYLSGLGLTGIDPSDYLSEEAQDALNDLSKLAATHVDDVDDSEDAEEDFHELHEYLRMAVMMIAEECTALREQATGKH